MSTVTPVRTFEPEADTKAEIATLSAAVVSTSNPLSIEDMIKQIRRIAEHAGVIVSVIYEQTYDDTQGRVQSDAQRRLPAFRALEEFHRTSRK